MELNVGNPWVWMLAGALLAAVWLAIPVLYRVVGRWASSAIMYLGLSLVASLIGTLLWAAYIPQALWKEIQVKADVREKYEILSTEIALLLDDPVLAAALGYSPGVQQISRLTAWGLQYLSDEQLIERAELIRKWLNVTDVTHCAAAFRSGPDMRVQLALQPSLLHALDISQVQKLATISAAAFRAAVLDEERQPLSISNDDIDISMARLLIRQPPEIRATMQKVLATGAGLQGSDTDVCTTARALYNGLSKLPDRYRSTLARAIVLYIEVGDGRGSTNYL